MSPRAGRGLLLAGVTVAVVAAVIGGLLVVGAPESERQRRLDEIRVTDLMAIRDALVEEFDRSGGLPASLEELARHSPLPVRLKDPVGGRLYDYAVLGDSTFRLCAVFDFATRDEPERMRIQAWAHRAGRQCYRFRLGRRLAAGAPRGDLLPLIEDEIPDGP